MFPIRRLRELTIHETLIGPRRRVGGKGLDLGQRRREPGEIEGHAPRERHAIRLRLRAQPFLLQSREDEAV